MIKNNLELYKIKDSGKYKNNVYILADREKKEALIIDPSFDVTLIMDVLHKNDLKLTTILVTHLHEDHIKSVKIIQEIYNAKMYVSLIEKTTFNYVNDNMECVSDNDIIKFGNTDIKCIATPGHTAGSICYMIENKVFTGDTVFIEGCGMCTSEGASPEQMYYSIRKLNNIIEDLIEVYPAHTYDIEPGVNMGFVKENNIYFMLDNKEDFIFFRMRSNQNGLYDFK